MYVFINDWKYMDLLTSRERVNVVQSTRSNCDSTDLRWIQEMTQLAGTC